MIKEMILFGLADREPGRASKKHVASTLAQFATGTAGGIWLGDKILGNHDDMLSRMLDATAKTTLALAGGGLLVASGAIFYSISTVAKEIRQEGQNQAILNSLTDRDTHEVIVQDPPNILE